MAVQTEMKAQFRLSLEIARREEDGQFRPVVLAYLDDLELEHISNGHVEFLLALAKSTVKETIET
jgi:hypothetical protein